MDDAAGVRFRQAIEVERPLQVVGVVNAYCARLAEQAGFRALYLSGAGVANASFGVPDVGITTFDNVLEDARRIMGASSLPLLVDCDTGWGSAQAIARAVRELGRAGVAAIHIEDQIDAKRCGHLPGKELVSADEMVCRLQAAMDARTDTGFVIMARTDAVAVEGFEAAVDRACRYAAAGADMIFAEALTDLDQFCRFAQAVPVPVLANMTEFGRTPLHGLDDLRATGIRLVLYPLTAFRAMSAAALCAYETLRRDGTQGALLAAMQTRDDLYRVLDYEVHDRRISSIRNTKEQES